jgi:putative transposase
VSRKKYTAEQLIQKLRDAEIALAQGQPVGAVCKKLEVTEQTYYRWRKEYGGLKLDQARRLKGLEKENVQPKKILVDQALDISILREVAQANF